MKVSLNRFQADLHRFQAHTSCTAARLANWIAEMISVKLNRNPGVLIIGHNWAAEGQLLLAGWIIAVIRVIWWRYSNIAIDYSQCIRIRWSHSNTVEAFENIPAIWNSLVIQNSHSKQAVRITQTIRIIRVVWIIQVVWKCLEVIHPMNSTDSLGSAWSRRQTRCCESHSLPWAYGPFQTVLLVKMHLVLGWSNNNLTAFDGLSTWWTIQLLSPSGLFTQDNCVLVNNVK